MSVTCSRATLLSIGLVALLVQVLVSKLFIMPVLMKGGEDIVFWLFDQLSVHSLTPFRAM